MDVFEFGVDFCVLLRTDRVEVAAAKLFVGTIAVTLELEDTESVGGVLVCYLPHTHGYKVLARFAAGLGSCQGVLLAPAILNITYDPPTTDILVIAIIHVAIGQLIWT